MELLRYERSWGALQGLMLGVAVLHAQQPIAVMTGDLDMTPKIWVAVGGAILYTLTLVGLLMRERWALLITTFGPAVGLTSVLAGGLLGLGTQVDTFQIMGGIPQVVALVIASRMLLNGRS